MGAIVSQHENFIKKIGISWPSIVVNYSALHCRFQNFLIKLLGGGFIIICRLFSV